MLVWSSMPLVGGVALAPCPARCVAFSWEVGKGVVGEFEQCSLLDVNEVLLDACIPQTSVVVEVLDERQDVSLDDDMRGAFWC